MIVGICVTRNYDTAPLGADTIKMVVLSMAPMNEHNQLFYLAKFVLDSGSIRHAGCGARFQAGEAAGVGGSVQSHL